MNDTLKWILIGVGAYLLYEQYAAAPAAITSTPQPAGPPPANQPPAGPTAAQKTAQGNLADLMQAGVPAAIQALAAKGSPGTQVNLPGAAGGGSITMPPQLTQYQWDWYMRQILPGMPDDLSAYNLGNNPIPFSTYWTALTGWANAAANSPTGLAGVKAKKPALPLIANTYDLNATGW